MRKCSVGPLNAKKILFSKINLFGLHKIAWCDIGVHGNTSDTVAGSFASRPVIDTCVPHIFSLMFSLFHLFKKSKLSDTGETKWSLNSKEQTGSGRLA